MALQEEPQLWVRQVWFQSQSQHSLHEKANQIPYSFFLCKIRMMVFISLLWTECFSLSNSCVGAITSRVAVFGDGTTKEVIKVCCWSITKSCPTLWDPMDCSTPGFPVFHCLRSLPKLISIELVKPSNHLTLCHPLLLLPSIFPSIRVFSDESADCIRWPKYWSFSFSISPSNE